MQNNMNFGVNCVIPRNVRSFPGRLLLASSKRLLLKGEMPILWVSERERNDSLWGSDILKAYLLKT